MIFMKLDICDRASERGERKKRKKYKKKNGTTSKERERDKGKCEMNEAKNDEEEADKPSLAEEPNNKVTYF
jgi:hypothetical protein